MLKGIYISEDGVVQQIGDVTTYIRIIAVIEEILPQLRKQQQEKVLSELSTEDLLRAVETRKKETSSAKVA
jgi:hypothetical protein